MRRTLWLVPAAALVWVLSGCGSAGVLQDSCSDCRHSFSEEECLGFSSHASCDRVARFTEAACPTRPAGCLFSRCAEKPLCLLSPDAGR